MRFSEFLTENSGPFIPGQYYYVLKEVPMEGITSLTYDERKKNVVNGFFQGGFNAVVVCNKGQKLKFVEYVGQHAVFTAVGMYMWFIDRADWDRLGTKSQIDRIFLDDLKEETLLELGGRYSRTDKNWLEYTNWLRFHKNMTHLGVGGSARVFPHPTIPNVAVKVFLTADKNYRTFARWCLQNQSNPWLPKIHSVHNFKKEEKSSRGYDKYSVMFLERLEPITLNRYEKFVEQTGLSMQTFGVGPVHQPKMAKVIRDLKKKKMDPKLIEVLQFLHDSFLNYDLHPGNFMLRGNQVVFVDPVASYMHHASLPIK